MGGGKWQLASTTTNYIISHSGEGDRQGTVKNEQGEQCSMLNTLYTSIAARAGFGSARDKKVERKK